ncbi:hypothetical protein ES703_92091 [subsurface metagenome]
MRIKRDVGHWGDAVHFGPFIEWQDWNIWRHCFSIGFSFGPWDFRLQISLWDVDELIDQLVKNQGMTERKAWNLCDRVRKKLPDPYSNRVDMKKEVEKALAKRKQK